MPVRQQLKGWMRSLGYPRDVVEDARVVLSELVGNCVRHARPLSDGTILISWGRNHRGIRISVTDGGSISHPHKVDASTSAVSGRGVAIVEALASVWWAEQGRGTSTIHAQLRF